MKTSPKAAAPLEELPKLDEHLCFALYAAGNHMTRLFVPFLKKLDVTYPQYLVLVVLWALWVEVRRWLRGEVR